jgi:hypothetical protein
MHCSLHLGQVACIAMPLIASNNTVKPNKAIEPVAFLVCALRVNKCEVGSSFPDEDTFQPSLFVFGWKKFPTNRWHPAVYLLTNRALIFRILPLPFSPNSYPQTAPHRVPGTKTSGNIRCLAPKLRLWQPFLGAWHQISGGRSQNWVPGTILGPMLANVQHKNFE